MAAARMPDGKCDGAIAVAPQPFSDDDVQEASFRLESAIQGTEPARQLFLRTYRLPLPSTGIGCLHSSVAASDFIIG